MSTELPPDQGAPAHAASGRQARVPAEHVEVGTAHIEINEADVVRSPASRKASRRLAWSLVVLFVLVIGLTAASLLYSNNQAAINRCQRIVNTRFQQADISRANATKASADAQVELWNALLALRGTQAQKLAEFNQAFSTYKAKLHQVTAIKFPAQTGTQSCAGSLGYGCPVRTWPPK